ncbi:hypothetical protein [Aquimarina longa]|uniref:hypothetical protein n=1 Tax=Aquimarina longa TaxID=1080221 RepID=UPI00078150C5|nr:hypothetical protein [Aquimarina longa]
MKNSIIIGLILASTSTFAQLYSPNGAEPVTNGTTTNVGIGTSEPTETLDINGNLRVRGIPTTGSYPGTTTKVHIGPAKIHTYAGYPGFAAVRLIGPGDNEMTMTSDQDIFFKIKKSKILKLNRHFVDFWGSEIRIRRDGKMGIGTDKPSEKLDVHGNIHVTGQILMDNSDFRLGLNDGRDKGSNTSQRAMVHYTNDRLILNYAGDFEGGTEIHGNKVNIDGNLGIGTKNPDHKLTVNGKIHCKEILVDLEIPADYVFEKYYTGISSLKEGYTMPSLEEVEIFTKENHHLPNVPSAKEIQEEGLQLKEMTNILLQKVEELTLYTIEQEKRIKDLEGKLSSKKG